MEFLTDREDLELAENLTRGVASVFSKHLATMNNDLLSPSEEMTAKVFGLLVHANTLFGAVMERFHLQLRGFEIPDDRSFDLILEPSNDCPIGFILEVDLEFPNSLHKLHKHFPLAPT